MIEYKLNIGDVAVSATKASYSCLGLGSCIGLFIQDRDKGLSGGAHIFLPDSEGEYVHKNKFYNVTAALNELLTQFKLLGSDLLSVRAKVVGGSNVINVSIPVGQRNAESVVSHLIARKIFIAALDVGGIFCRTVKFQSDTGQLSVWTPQINERKIY